jgi:hypothetical protein
LRALRLKTTFETASGFLLHGKMIYFDFILFFTFFADQNLVEKFELIATTGKNAKMPIIPFFQSTKLTSFCLLLN